MNNFRKIITLSSMILFLLTSCSKKETLQQNLNQKQISKYAIDENGFYTNMEDAVINAQNKDQNIIIIVTAEGDDDFSNSFMDIARRNEFKLKVMKAFTVVHMDFSAKSFKKTIALENATEEEIAEAAFWENQLKKNTQYATLLNVDTTPAFYLMTKDEYFICQLRGNLYGEEYIPSTVDQFVELIFNYSNKMETVNKLANKTKEGSKIDRINAIDELYEYTDYNQRVFLADLAETVIKLDRKNESGLLGKYIYADAENLALDYYTRGDVEKGVKAYISAANNSKIDAKYKQRALFMASYFLIMSESNNISQIAQYLNHALKADPEGELADTIRDTLQFLMNRSE